MTDDYKLFIWSEPYPIAYGGSIAYAVGRTVEEARDVAMQARVAWFGMTPCDADPLPNSDGRWTLGEPTRVLPVPCAEFCAWSE